MGSLIMNLTILTLTRYFNINALIADKLIELNQHNLNTLSTEIKRKLYLKTVIEKLIYLLKLGI